MAYVPLVAVQQGLVVGQASTPAIATVNRGNVPPQPHDGNVFYVDSTAGSVAPDGSIERPYLTISTAHAASKADNNDIIYLKNTHAEALSSATALALSKADVQIIGLGRGANRPTVTLDTANTTTITVSAANVLVKNVIFNANFLNIAALFSLTTATDFTLIDCGFTDAGASLNFVDIIDTNTTNNAADDLVVARCEWISVATGCAALVDVDADIDGLTVMDCFFDLGINGVISAIFEVAAGKDTTNINVRSNNIRRMVTASAVQVGTWVDTTTQNTGVCAYNIMRCVDTSGELVLTATSNVSFYENKSSSVAGLNGYTLPVADA